MISFAILAFCRVTTGLVFALSSLSKVRNIPQFKQAILRFQILPPRVSGLAAILFLCGECAVVLLVTVGGSLLFYGFALAIFLLLIFSLALASVLARKLRASCNCFGLSEQPVMPIDIWRNVGFLCCAIGGCGAQGWPTQAQPFGLIEWLLVALVATTFVLIWTQLSSLVQFFR